MLILLTNCSVQKNIVPMKSMMDIDYGIEVNYLKLKNDINLAYTDQGSKDQKTLLFIHGLGSYLPAWKNNINELKAEYRCIAIDLPGYGKSSKGNYDVSMDFFADLIAEICSTLNFDQVSLIGHSMGGQIAISTSLKYPNLVEKLILVSPAGFETFTVGEREWFRNVMSVQAVRLTSPEQIRTNFAYNFYNLPEDAKFMISDRIAMRTASDFLAYCQHITYGVDAMVNSPVHDFLKDIKQPTLIIFGEQDNLIPNRYLHGGKTEKIATIGTELIPNSELKMINHAGHFVMFEKSMETNQHILDFMKKKI